MFTPSWRDEIFACGNFPQENTEETQDEGARLWERYVQLADNVRGDEGVAGVAALVRSFRVEEDFGAYQSAISALERFPLKILGAGVAESGTALTEIPECWSGNILLIVARTEESVHSFNEKYSLLGARERASIRQLIDFHESNEWLAEDDDKGKLAPP
ncbi:hypothetical protein [Streptomyces sp. NPDC046979]|uniref:hypothetical protein n=1 Tax=Streptomyces sp. NPDC046979 TaxID=3154604 RepID=UPI0033DA3B80